MRRDLWRLKLKENNMGAVNHEVRHVEDYDLEDQGGFCALLITRKPVPKPTGFWNRLND
jgi:hypothetical protein